MQWAVIAGNVHQPFTPTPLCLLELMHWQRIQKLMCQKQCWQVVWHLVQASVPVYLQFGAPGESACIAASSCKPQGESACVLSHPTNPGQSPGELTDCCLTTPVLVWWERHLYDMCISETDVDKNFLTTMLHVLAANAWATLLLVSMLPA